MTIYKGFSTQGRTRKFRLTDFELAKQDLLNHLNIRQGEKLMDAKFGSIIWNMLFEPLTDEVKSVISADLLQIVSYDPRIRCDSVSILEYDHGLQVEIVLYFLPTNQTSALNIKFDQSLVR